MTMDIYRDLENLQREQILAGLEQIKEQRTRPLDEVCDRLERKYREAGIRH